MKISMIAVVLTASALSFSGTAGAQSEVGGPTDTLAEVTVTARKITEDIQRVPISITALSGDTLEHQSVTNIQQLETSVPNLFLQQSGTDPNSLYLSLRGQRQNDTPPTVDPSVGLYIDGLYYPRTVGLGGAMLDIDQVEVLRGPQGTLFGRNTTGGAMSINSKDPTTEKFGGDVSAEYGNFETGKISAVVNVPINDDLAGRFVFQRTERGAYAHDDAGHELGTLDDTYIRGKLKAEVGSVTAVLTVIYQNAIDGQNVWQLSGLSPATATSPAGGVSVLEVAAESGLPFTPAGLAQASNILQGYVNPPRNVSGGTVWPISRYMSEVAGLDVKDEINNYLTIRSITGFEHLNRYVSTDLDSTPYDIASVAYQNHDKYYSEELQVLGGSRTFNWVAGGYYGNERDDYKEDAQILTVISPPSSPDISQAPITNLSYAGFVQANWEFVPTWRLTAGVRWSHDTRELIADNSVGGICVVPAAGYAATTASPASMQCPRPFRADFAKPSWLVSLDHQFTDDVLGYIKASYGYRSGGLNFRGSTYAASFAPFAPETVTEFEGGFKWELLDRRLRINADVFHDKYNDAQESVIIAGPTNVPIGLTENAASAKIDGFELESSLRPTSDLTLSASAGYIYPRYTKFEDLTGNRTNESFGIPRLTASTSIDYVIHTPLGPLVNHADYRYQSDFQIEPETPTLIQEYQPGYGLLDARLTLSINQWDIALFGRNLTNKQYRVSGSTVESDLGFNVVLLGDPRTFGIGAKMHF